MGSYSLTELGAYFTEYEGKRLGMNIPCPNCGVQGGVYFSPLPEAFGSRASWQVTGETLEDISLTPSVLMHGHFHSWVKNGKLEVDSIFSCVKAEENK